MLTKKQIKTFFFITIGAFLLFSFKAHGTVSKIQKDQPAISDGYLFEKADFLKARTAVAQNVIYKEQLLNSVELLHIEGNRIANRDDTIKYLKNQNENNELLHWFYFAGGVVAGGLVVDIARH